MKVDPALLTSAKRHLRRADSVMAGLIAKHKPFWPAGTPVRRTPYFHSLVRSIVSQQLSIKAAATIEQRLRSRQGGGFFNAGKLLRLSDAQLRACGLSGAKARYIHGLAQSVADGALRFRKLVSQDDDTVRALLMRHPGIGRWSADIFLMFSLHRPDVFPIGDLVLRKSVQFHYRLPEGAREDSYIAIAQAWRPYRSIASRYLWAAGLK